MIFPKEIQHFKNNLDKEVSNCLEAAIYRNISLDKELKTIVLTNKFNELYVFNTLGHCKLRVLDEDFKWVSKKQLSQFGLQSGTINPFSVSKQIPHIKFMGFCNQIFKQETVYTNDGTLTGTIIIPTNYFVKNFNNAYFFSFSSVI